MNSAKNNVAAYEVGRGEEGGSGGGGRAVTSLRS